MNAIHQRQTRVKLSDLQGRRGGLGGKTVHGTSSGSCVCVCKSAGIEA